MTWLKLIPEFLGMGSTMISGWMQRKAISANSAVKISELRAKGAEDRATSGHNADIDWDTQNTKNAQTSWKDEYWTIILSIPAVLCFISEEWAAKVNAGFTALDNTPEWYQIALLVAIAAAFGYRKIVTPFLNRVGAEKRERINK